MFFSQRSRDEGELVQSGHLKGALFCTDGKSFQPCLEGPTRYRDARQIGSSDGEADNPRSDSSSIYRRRAGNKLQSLK